jgi:hypothetical protein
MIISTRASKLCVSSASTMDFSLLEENIRSAAARAADLRRNEKERLSLLAAARELVNALEPPDEAISNVAVLREDHICARALLWLPCL